MQALEERYALLAHAARRPQPATRSTCASAHELPDPELRGLSLVAANYGVARRNLGTVSLFGPTRMDYRLAIATVREAAQILSEYVEGVYG